MAEQYAPDLILLDVDMPGMLGFDACKRLKSNPFTENIPVIFVTWRKCSEDEVLGLESGAVDYITRPFTWSIVYSRVKTHIELKRKTDILKRFVNIDGLTSIANRRRFDEFITIEWKRAERTHSPLSLIMMDVDYFKLFNDHYGHPAGDDCLIAIAKTLQHTMKRSIDLVARYGGEEFIAVLPETPFKGAMKAAKKIRDAVNDLAIPHAYSNAASYVTLSLGVAEVIPHNDQQSTELINTADSALYKAKEHGRNRIGYQSKAK
jgi:diguanylate cyclase (GGDEF)-like protein